MDTHIIEAKDLQKRYKEKYVLRDLSLTVPKGSVCGLLGRNGEGKTTLIKIILGLLKPSSGSVQVLSDNPWKFNESTKEKIGYVPQTDRQYPWLTVGQLIEYTASFYKQWNQSKVDHLVKEWGVVLNDKVALLSEGQAQKVSIILSLGHDPELLILDEPVASLDPAARRQFLKTILEIVSDQRATVFFSTHITSDIERVADRVAILHQGKIVFNDELDILKDSVKRLRVYSSKPLPENFYVEGAIHCEKSTQGAIVSMRHYSNELKDHIERKWGVSVAVEDVNLEEIFLELSR